MLFFFFLLRKERLNKKIGEREIEKKKTWKCIFLDGTKKAGRLYIDSELVDKAGVATDKQRLLLVTGSLEWFLYGW